MNRLLSRVWVLVAFALYLPIFFIPLPPQFVRQSVALVDEALLLALCALIAFALFKGGWFGKALALAGTLAAFTLPLLRTWETAASGHNLLLGLLPFVDANGYYVDALRLLAGKLFSAPGVYRPLFTAFLSVILATFNGNVQLLAVFFAAFTALGIFSLAFEARRTYGVWPAVALIYFVQFFYRQLVGAPMTEQLGIPIGAFGLTVLIQSTQKRSLWLYTCGLFLLSLGLTIRAGAYFVLPVLILYGLYLFNFSPVIARRSAATTKQSPPSARGLLRREERPPRNDGTRRTIPKSILLHGLLFSLAILIPIGLDALVRGWVVTSGAVTSGNFALTLYGQAVGGRGWRSIFVDHPELSSAPLYELGAPAYKYAFEAIKANPFGLVLGSLRALVKFFSPAYLFNVILLENATVTLVLQITSFVFFLAGLWFVWKKRKEPLHALLLVTFAGIVISVPFLPPFDGGGWWGGIRVHGATLGVHLLITGIGLAGLLKKIPLPVFKTQTENFDGGNWFWTLGFILAIYTLLGAWTLHPTGARGDVPPEACAPGEDAARFRLSPGSYLRIEPDDSGLKTYVPIVLMKHVDRSMADFPHGEFAFVPRRINERSIFTTTVDWITGDPLWVIAPPAMADLQGNLVTVCGKKVEVWGAIDFPLNVFYVSTFQ
jgi:hypothetical protein